MAEKDPRWNTTQRYEFIEWRVYWTGRVNRKDLEDQFGISTPQASIVLSDYREVAGNNIEYNASDKTYVATRDFRPVFLKLSPERYLIQLQALETRAIRKQDTWFDKVPPIDVVPTISRGPEAYTLRALVRAIETGSSIGIYYPSLKRTGMRNICPHAFVNDGFRWHCRALDVERGEFRDYVLGRILSINPPQPSNADPSDDIEWNTQIKLHLVAHPSLDQRQQEAIAHDYRMEDNELVISMRLPVAFYFIKRYNLDLQDKIEPERLQLCLKNLDEFNRACEAAKQRSKVLVAARMKTAE
jgi:predicted DNA-binding transcriptional regulator YafY